MSLLATNTLSSIYLIHILFTTILKSYSSVTTINDKLKEYIKLQWTVLLEKNFKGVSTHRHIFVYVYIFMYMCVCVRVCMWVYIYSGMQTRAHIYHEIQFLWSVVLKNIIWSLTFLNKMSYNDRMKYLVYR